MTSPTAQIRLVQTIGEIPADAWDACANPAHEIFDPFISHAFLAALEESGSATAETGWQPLHLVMEDGPELLGAVPLYLKSHSYGEYVFDHGWANAFEEAGGRYYPKLLSGVPFTPVTGRRLLARGMDTQDTVHAQLLGGLTQSARQLGVSSLHLNFPVDSQARLTTDHDFLQRTDRQFHWHNKNYGAFDDFLSGLASRKRKAVRKERVEALRNGIIIEWITGKDIAESHWDAFFSFYMDTGARKWGSPYLTRLFFSLIGERLSDNILLVMARRDGRYIAGALNLIGGDALYGRNWGATEHHDCLHFEVCYYQAIDFAIEKKLARVEAGAQGAHKLARGYVPALTRSAHWIAHAGLRNAVADFLARERAAVAEEMAIIEANAPFRKE